MEELAEKAEYIPSRIESHQNESEWSWSGDLMLF